MSPATYLRKVANLSRHELNFGRKYAAKSMNKVGFVPVSIALSNRKDCLSTGCKILDKLLGGGIRCGGITELAGESSCGKTQICMQMSLMVQYPSLFGGLEAGAVYICTEDVFPSNRLQQLISLFPTRINEVTSEIKFGENIFIEHIVDVEGLKQCLNVRLPRLLNDHRVGLLVIDSIAGIFRDYEADAISRATELRHVGGRLHFLAERYNLVVICINQVTAAIGLNSSETVAALGLAWANMVTTRLHMSRSREFQERSLKVIFAPHLQCRSLKFCISSSGIFGIADLTER